MSVQDHNQHQPYRPDIDGLRALAILLVVLFHALPSAAVGGYIGVDIFFVISGYLISGIILKSLDAGSFSLADFYVRRCRRILPALCLMMLTVWLAGWLFLTPEEFKYIGREISAGAIFAENFMAQREAGYFDISSIRKPMLHLWSLGVEEQFYIFWPLILLIWQKLKLKTPYWLTGLLAASFAAGFYDEYHHSTAVFYLLPARFWELLCGAFLIYAQRRGYIPKTAPNFLSVAALLAIGLFSFALPGGMFFSFWWKLVPCLAAATLIAIGPRSWVGRTLLSNKPTVFLGRISYPLYLWHWPLLSINWMLHEGNPTPTSIYGSVALAVALATLTYLYFEKPMQHFISGKKNTSVLAVSAASIAFFSLLGCAAFTKSSWRLNSPWPTVTNSAELDAESVAKAVDRNWWTDHGLQYDRACLDSHWAKDKPADYCRLTDAHPRIAVIGDSHANHLVPGLEALDDPTFSKLVQISFGGCIYFGGVQVTSHSLTRQKAYDCTESNNHYMDDIRDDPTIKYVIISDYWQSNKDFNTQNPDNNRLEVVTGTDFDPNLAKMDLLREGVSRLISDMEKAGKRVILFIDIPTMSFEPADCARQRVFSLAATHTACENPRSIVIDEKQREQRAMIAALAERHKNLIIVDPTSVLCDDQLCYTTKDRKMLYRDASHLSEDGSHYVISRAFTKALHDAGIKLSAH